MGKSKRRQSTSALSSNLGASMPEKITDDDIYAAFGLTKDGSDERLKLETSTPRRRSKKKAKKRQSAPVKRMSIYDVLYEDEDKYEIPKGVFDVESPQSNEKKLKRPKSTGKPVASKIPTLEAETSIFDLLISPRENKETYGKKKKKVKSKELVADLGTPTLDDEEEPTESPAEPLLVLSDTPVNVRPIGNMTKRRKESKKVRSNSLVIDLGEPPKAVAESPESLSASDSQLVLNDEYLEIQSGSTPTTRRKKKTKKVRTDSLLVDLGAPPMSVAENSESSFPDYVAITDNETLHISPSSMTKRDKKAKKIKPKSLTMDLGNPIVDKDTCNSLSASDSQLCLDDDLVGIKSGSTPTRRRRKSKKVRTDSMLIDLGEPPMTIGELAESASFDVVASNDNETLEISPNSMTKRGKKEKKVKSKSLTMDLGNPVVEKESTGFLHVADAVLPLNDESPEINLSKGSSRNGLDQEVLPRRRCRSHSPHARKSRIHFGMTELHVIEESSEEESEDDDRWSTHSSDSPPHVPRKRRKRHKSCSPPLTRSPNRLWLESFEVSLEDNDKNKTKKKKKKRKSKEKSVEKSPDKTKKSIKTNGPEIVEVENHSSMSSLDSNASSKDSKKASHKKKRKSIKKESRRNSTTSVDSSIQDSVEKPSSRQSLDSNTSSKKESPKKKRRSSRKSTAQWEPSLHDSMEIAAAVEAAEEEAIRETEEARRKAEIEQAKLRAEEEARRLAEQEAAAARLRLQVAEAQRKVEEEEQLRAMQKAEKQAEQEAIMRAQDEAKRKSVVDEERKRLKAEQERLYKERAEIERLRNAEQERLDKEIAELQRQKAEEVERLAREKADLGRRRLEEEQRLQIEKEKQERELMQEKARIKAEQEEAKARLLAENQEREQVAKAEKLRLKAEKQERDRLAKQEQAKIKAEKDAELARIKAEKDAEKARIKAEQEAEKTRIRREKIERERMAAEEKVRIEAEKQAELKRQEETALQKAKEKQPLKLKKPSIVGRDYSIDSLFQGSIDNSLHAESEAERLIRERKQLEREMANLERQKNSAKARLQRRKEAIRAAVKAEKAKSTELDKEVHHELETSKPQQQQKESAPRRQKDSVTKEKRGRTPSPEAGEEAKQRARKEAWIRKQEKRRRTEEQAAEDYRLGKLDGRRSISKNDRQFASSWNKVLVS